MPGRGRGSGGNSGGILPGSRSKEYPPQSTNPPVAPGTSNPVPSTPVPTPVPSAPAGLQFVTVKIFFYFLFKFPEDSDRTPCINFISECSEIKHYFRNHCLWVEAKVAQGKEMRFKIKANKLEENRLFLSSNMRTVPPDYVQDTLLYVEFSNQKFDNTFLSHTTEHINTVKPFEEVALFLAKKCPLEQFERETGVMFNRMKQDCACYNLTLNFEEFLCKLVSLQIAKEEVYTKGVIVYDLATKINLNIQNKIIPLSILRDSLPTLTKFPNYLNLAIQLSVFGGEPEARRFFCLTSALACSDQNSVVRHISEFKKLACDADFPIFTPSEIELLTQSKFNCKPSEFCVSLAMGEQISDLDGAMTSLFSSPDSLNSYNTMLKRMRPAAYAKEWEFCLDLCPKVHASIPFTLNSDKFPIENKKNLLEVVESLLRKLMQSKHQPYKNIWASHLAGEVFNRIQRENRNSGSEPLMQDMFSVLQIVSADAFVTREVFNKIPKTESTLIPRCRMLLNTLTNIEPLLSLEKDVINDLISTSSKQTLRSLNDVLYRFNKSKENQENWVFLYELHWKQLLKKQILELSGSLPQKKHSCFLGLIRKPLDNSDSDLFYYLFTVDVRSLYDQAYELGLLSSHLEVLTADARTLAERINNNDILADSIAVLDDSSLLASLQVVLGDDYVVNFDALKRTFTSLKDEWEAFLRSLLFMKNDAQFNKQAESYVIEQNQAFTKLKCMPIKDWTSPNCPAQMRQVSLWLSKLQNSRIFCELWHDLKLGSSVAASETELILRWIEYCEVYIKEWKNCVGKLQLGTLSVNFLCSLLRKVDNYLDSSTHSTKTMTITNVEAEIRRNLENKKQEMEKVLANFIQKEAALSSELLQAHLEEQKLVKQVTDFMQGISVKNDFFALRELLSTLQISVPVSIEAFCALPWDKENCLQYGTVCSRYTDVLNALPRLSTVIRGFPWLFWVIMFKERLISVLESFNDAATLNARIDNRQGEEIREDTHEILHSLRIICEPKSIFSHPVFGKMMKKSVAITLEELLDFLVSCGGAVQALALLKDYIIKGGEQAIREALQTDSEEKHTIAIVKNLLLHGGFTIEVKDNKVSVTATYKEASRTKWSTVYISAEELEALPSQLLLTSGVITKMLPISDVDAPLPENIALVQDRERYVFKFNFLFDTAFRLSGVIKKLCEFGHPGYQKLTINFECSWKSADLLQFVDTREEVLRQWTNVFSVHRESHPILSFLSRSQLVSCLCAMGTKNKDLLVSTLLSVGCKRESLSKNLDHDLPNVSNITKASDFFTILASLLTEHFDEKKLVNNTLSPDTNEINFPESNPRSKCVLVRIMHDCPLEEVICGAHIYLFKRVPSPIEILFCNSQTTEIDVADFLDRWALYGQIPVIGKSTVAFWLVGIEHLSYTIQTRSMQQLFRQVEKLSDDHPKLFLVTKNDTKTYISTVLLREEVQFNKNHCQQLCKLITPAAAALTNIIVVFSKFPGEGKTTTIIRKFLCDKKDTYHVQFSLDTTPMNSILKRLMHMRPITSGQGLVLHLNVGHQVHTDEANLFLCQYLLLASWRDNTGFTFPRHEQDTVVVELCNTGEKDERDRITICKYFRTLPLDTGISPISMCPTRMNKRCYYWKSVQQFEVGTKMLIATFNTMTEAGSFLSHRNEILAKTALVSNDELYYIVLSIACDNFCSGKHLMTVHTKPASSMKCEKCKSVIQPKEQYAWCKYCQVCRCFNCMNKLPVPSASETAFLRRFFWVIVSQLQDFYYSFEQWNLAAVIEEGKFLLKLAYHFSRMILSLSRNVVKPAMEVLDQSAPLDDIQRCAKMDKFQNWKDLPFFLVTSKGYHITSTSSFSPLQFIIKNEQNTRDTDRYFIEWLRQNEAYLKPVNRSYLQTLCTALSSNAPYSFDQKNPPLKVLLEVIGCFSGALPVLHGIEAIRKFTGTTKLENVIKEASQAINFLESVGHTVNREMTCTEFITKCASYLNSLFGQSSEKPPYTLTADNILRIMAVQLRLFAGIPVCIMGETGCGKTETINFLSRVSGNEFQVINVQEGMKEKDLHKKMKPIIALAERFSDKKVVVLLDEVNTTFSLWTAKDMLCDHICFGDRMPPNIVFIAILNPWKLRSKPQQEAIAEMDVGGLDFLRYQQNTTKIGSENIKLVYQVHRAPETLYSLVWDWGTAATTETPLEELRAISSSLIVPDRKIITDEYIMASSMVSWLIGKLVDIQDLRLDFKRSGDGTEGEVFMPKFQSLLVELLLESQQFLRHDVYLDEISVVSLRDIRKACELIFLVFYDFWCQIRIKLQAEHLRREFPFFQCFVNSCCVYR